MAVNSAILVLADGSLFSGVSIGHNGIAVGEVVFNTSITGYQEILTDPSYARQMITLTYPHIGNVGVNQEDTESQQIFASGLIIRDMALLHSNFRSEYNLSDYLKQHETVGIADIDTRRLTRLIREKGSQAACIVADGSLTVEEAQQKAIEFGSMAGKDLAKEVSTQESYIWEQGEWVLGQGFAQAATQYHVVAYDFGIKRNILRILAGRGCKVTVVPATTPAEDVLAINPDGVFLSNGPGDPEPCIYAIQAIKTLLQKNIPIFGICLGHQLLGLALGAKTKKMKFGHHGANHPVQDLRNDTVAITAQNHGFEVDGETLPDYVEVTHKSLFDGSLQGISLKNAPIFSFQGHPEASSGPHDLKEVLFKQFTDNMQAYKSKK